MSNMTQLNHPKKHGKCQVSESNKPAAIHDAKAPAGTEDTKVSIQDLETTTEDLQALVESLGDSIKKMESICEHYLNLTRFRIQVNEVKQFASLVVNKSNESATKSESKSTEFDACEGTSTSEPDYTWNGRDLPSPKLMAQAVKAASDKNYIELYRRAYGSSPSSVLGSDR
ncbi:hypothetical protein P3T76_002282 [Phytophthora citrophthora]|uniref:Uncharacterized protein n=1 Tax=Phytophthora citrophthora TaxID=4793 RepID=A0AAD9GX67_9STRA|nr:hypothetical protein P3T76_002276 [Phytophthora citrophthora]KAK1946730.1 hypothetical protein P3T76_002282 [Phytophthora citrophthora]